MPEGKAANRKISRQIEKHTTIVLKIKDYKASVHVGLSPMATILNMRTDAL